MIPGAKGRAQRARVSLPRDDEDEWEGPSVVGVRAAVADTVLLAKARAALLNGPLGGDELLTRVLAMPKSSPALAERMLRVLFSEHPEFQRDKDGRWSIASLRAPAVTTPAPGLFETSFAVVDVETTGGGFRTGHRMTEFASVPVDGGVVGEPFTTLVNPERPIPPMIVSLTNITGAMVRSAPKFADVAQDVVRSIHNRVFVAHNVAFDWRFTAFEVERALGTRLSGDKLCTVKLARLLLPQLPRRSLDNLAYYFGVSIQSRHRAFGDAIATAHILTKLLPMAAERGWATWPDLRRRMLRGTGAAKRRRRTAMPTGVHVDPTL